MFPKQPRIKNEGYRRWVASLPCIACGIHGYSQAAHPNGGGMGTKHSDLDVFPLCCTRPGHVGCHMQHDLLIDMSLETRRALEREYVRRMHIAAREAGRKEFKVAA